MFDWVQDVPQDMTQLLNSSRNISLTVSKDGIILMNSLYLKFRAVNCLSIIRSLKQLSKVLVQWRFQEYLLGKLSGN